jgi:aspartyl-tRNA(Asn)/glutamyl-tRNA(Gln) amidotransferase subunit A
MKITRRQFAGLAAQAALVSLAPRRLRASSAGTDDPATLSLSEASARIKSGALTARALTDACLARIATYNPQLNAFITVMGEDARAQADGLDAELRAGRWRGPLHGIPVGLKDLIDTAGTRTTGGSLVFAGRVPAEDATVTRRLKDGGAVIIGKTNLHEFGMSGAYYGLVRNPWNLAHYSGGSSSGSGAAVCASLCAGALGTDTGGSVRGPASYCGIVGLKATYGLIPTRGIMPSARSLDHCGPLTRTVEDAALMLGQLAGYDELDISSVEHPREDYVAAMRQPVSGFRLGMPPECFDRLDPEVARVAGIAIEALARLTRGTRKTALPPTGATGMDSGGPGQETEYYAYHEEFFRTDASAYMLEERGRFEADARKASETAAQYARGLWELQRVRRTIDRSFADIDLMVMPTRQILAPKLADFARDLTDTTPREPRSTSNCDPFNVYGIPAISIPCGFSRDGLPVGLQIVGPHFAEGKVLALARAYEQACGWETKRPDLRPNA